MKLAARDADEHTCPRVTPAGAHVGGPIFVAAPVQVIAEHMQAARLADFARCSGDQDVIFEGASTVLVGGLPFATRDVHTAHAGSVISSASAVEVGGPVFALPANFVVKGNAAFQNALIRDLYYLSTLPSGKALIDRLAKSGQTVVFVPGATVDNSYCSPSDPTVVFGSPSGSTISFNPHVGLIVADANNKGIVEPPQAVLAHEMVHALNNAEGNHSFFKDKAPPTSQPDIEEEEARAIGTGSHSADYPTENSVRSDMGIPRRDNHYGVGVPSPTGDARPGGY